MIRTEALSKQFDDFCAVKGIGLHVWAGEILALLGPNGAGKTTTVRMLASILKPTSGRAWIDGHDTVEEPITVRRIVGVLTEMPGLYGRMKAREYLRFFGQLQGLDDKTCDHRSEQLMEQFGMGDVWSLRLGEYSKGMRQKLALIRAMLHDPPVLLLDEPTSAMDPHSARLVRDAIRDLRGDGRTIILCSHNLPEAEELADRIAIIRRGEIIASGTALELKARLLGPPLLELKVGGSLNGLVKNLDGLVDVDSQGYDWIRYRVESPTATNPLVIRKLASLGIDVVTLSEVPQSLEEVYLRVVSQDDAPL
jgi:ABC-2 type transport system ATP-binding protein